ncbi:MAG: exodeoxyribonuclease VII small subunit [Lachnospiraceae bacterium]|nr:exodeoxyribonuclease VII small subunit [Lachnospiraceae bacterium]
MATKKTENTETKTEKRSVDDMLNELAETVDKLDDEDISLEEAFKLYEKGMKLAKSCNEEIDIVEKKVLEITKDGEKEFE